MVQVLFDNFLAEVNDLVDVVGLHFQAGADGHENSARLLAEHDNIFVLHRVITDQTEYAGPDHGADLSQKSETFAFDWL